MTQLVWFRNDLRLADNPALTHAAQRGAVVPVYIYNPDEHGKWSPGGASSLRSSDGLVTTSRAQMVSSIDVL